MGTDVTYNFSGKNFVVTGASSGIGRQTARELAEAGAGVLAVARTQAALLDLANLYPDKITPGVCDVKDAQKLEECIKNFVSVNGKLDGCVHAAGILAASPLRFYDEAAAAEVMAVSFWAGIKLVQIVTRAKYCRAASSSILLGAVSGTLSPKGMFAYSAAKAALIVAVKALAKELADKKHRVNTISPGYVITKMTEDSSSVLSDRETMEKWHLLGLGQTFDVTGVILFLLSSRAGWITGTDMLVDGGVVLGCK